MEHSYIQNEYVERIMSMLRKKPANLTWICDYYEGLEPTWGTSTEATKEEFLQNSEYIESDYIILNHTKKLAIDINKVFEFVQKQTDSWPIHPLPILCNSDIESQGGGDFHQEDLRRATWKGDLIEIAQINYEEYKDVSKDVIFIEN